MREQRKSIPPLAMVMCLLALHMTPWCFAAHSQVPLVNSAAGTSRFAGKCVVEPVARPSRKPLGRPAWQYISDREWYEKERKGYQRRSIRYIVYLLLWEAFMIWYLFAS
mmetsp:Transcript_41018/g.76267  ORF Transcript_41018/g.76267 Transcript_41018/m.76267 type:complete len:109 (+) Transcript_41018:76-402(+)